MSTRSLNTFGRLVFGAFTVLWLATVVVVPTVGVWVGSSLAAFLNGPVWAVCAAGLLLFPLLPLAWEGWAQLRARKRERKRWDRARLLFRDRLVLRTLAINLVFLSGLLWRFPEQAFTALSARGDWVLDQVEHPVADAIRPWLFRAADGLAWLYEAAHENEYQELVDGDALPEDTPEPTPIPVPPPPKPSPSPAPAPGGDGSVGDRPVPAPDPSPRRPPAVPPTQWPQPDDIHPAIAAMPQGSKASVADVGRYIAAAEGDPHRRIKAIHDFVATHVAYDAPALAAGRYPPQDARTVLRDRVGVCAGYANLSKAIADVTGDEIVVVVGDSRARGGQVAGGGHAWNAARIDGVWRLFDATWDAGYVEGDRFVPEYRTSYLFTPPQIMGVTHFPEDPSWQLRSDPISRGEFVRQPMMRPDFYAQGFSLQTPQRSQITVDRDAEIRLGNPGRRHVLASFTRAGDPDRTRCDVMGGVEVRIRCALPSEGTYHVMLFSSTVEIGTYQGMGEIEINRRP